MNFNPDDCWILVHNVFNDDTIAGIIDSCESTGFSKGVIRKNEILPDLRDNGVAFLDRGAQHHVYDSVRSCSDRVNRKMFGYDLFDMEDIQVSRYKEQQHYTWHADNIFMRGYEAMQRKLSFVVMLSDPSDYQDGDFEFQDVPSPTKTKLTKGSMLLFPSYLIHRVKPVTSGLRYSMVGWLLGPRFR